MQALRGSSSTIGVTDFEERETTKTATSFTFYDQSFKQPSIKPEQSFTYTRTGRTSNTSTTVYKLYNHLRVTLYNVSF